MFYFVLALHLFLCLVLVTLVLLQQGKGASVGAVFGGSSNTLFGAAGANTVLTKVTTGVAVAFMVTSVVLVRMYGSHVVTRTGTSNPLAGSALAGAVVQAPAVPAAEDAPSADSTAADSPADKAEGAAAVAEGAVAKSPEAASSAPVPQQDAPKQDGVAKSDAPAAAAKTGEKK